MTFTTRVILIVCSNSIIFFGAIGYLVLSGVDLKTRMMDMDIYTPDGLRYAATTVVRLLLCFVSTMLIFSDSRSERRQKKELHEACLSLIEAVKERVVGQKPENE